MTIMPLPPLDTGVIDITDFGADRTGTIPAQAALSAALLTIPRGGEIQFPDGKYLGPLSITSRPDITLTGVGAGAVIHNASAGVDAVSAVDCNQLKVQNLRAQGTVGTRDGFHFENCQRAHVEDLYVQGSGRNGIYAQRCFGINVTNGCVGIDVVSPYPTGVTNCLSGLVLSWDGLASDSGCNQAVINGGFYVVGKSQSWAIQIIKADNFTLLGPISELSGGGIYIEDSQQFTIGGYYGEANPSDVEYLTGTASVTIGTTAVTGVGTAWNTNNGQGSLNAEKNKFLCSNSTTAPRAVKVNTPTSDTALQLQSNWTGATLAAATYVIQGMDLYMKNCKDGTIVTGRGGGAVFLESCKRIRATSLVTNRLTLDENTTDCNIEVTVNRASAIATVLIDAGNRNRITQNDYNAGTPKSGGRVYGGDSWPATQYIDRAAFTAFDTSGYLFMGGGGNGPQPRIRIDGQGSISRGPGGATAPITIDARGTGSPEGVITGGPGSRYAREDGGAGTSFYVKESGVGNTGWVAK